MGKTVFICGGVSPCYIGINVSAYMDSLMRGYCIRKRKKRNNKGKKWRKISPKRSKTKWSKKKKINKKNCPPMPIVNGAAFFVQNQLSHGTFITYICVYKINIYIYIYICNMYNIYVYLIFSPIIQKRNGCAHELHARYVKMHCLSPIRYL
jgi:hypothetical protein